MYNIIHLTIDIEEKNSIDVNLNEVIERYLENQIKIKNIKSSDSIAFTDSQSIYKEMNEQIKKVIIELSSNFDLLYYLC